MTRRFSYPLLLLLTGALNAFATSQEIIQRHLDATPGGKLVVDVDFGTVEVTGDTDGKTVAIKAHRIVEIADKAREKEFVEAAPITITQENNVITIRARSNRQWRWQDAHTRTDARYAVQVPKNFNADLHTGGGQITASDISGDLRANTAGGRLNFARIHGPMDAKTAGGAVKLAECDGTIKIRTSGGQIEAVSGKGSLDAQTAGGQVSVRDFAGRVDIASNGGQLNLNDVDGPLNAKTGGGAIHATMTTVSDVNLETSAGEIAVAIPANGGFNIDAESSVGAVTTDLPIATQRKDRDTLIGALNGGGKPLYLRTSAGSISIRAAGSEKASR